MKLVTCNAVIVMSAGLALGQAPTAHGVPFPHPVITEVLFNVPSGQRGDASADGTRDAVGDEFVELINPHDKPIDLKGYVLTDSAGWPGPVISNPEAKDGAANGDDTPPGDDAAKPTQAKSPAKKAPHKPNSDKPGDARRGAVKFVFPSLTLQPGERVVVFNGYKQRFTGPVGSEGGAPKGKDPKMGDAYVFSMRNDSKFSSFSNTGDWVGLSSPTGQAVETLLWGTPKTLPPGAMLSETAPAGAGSVQRTSIDGEFVRHQDLPGDDGAKMFSPGAFAWTAPAASEPDKK